MPDIMTAEEVATRRHYAERDIRPSVVALCDSHEALRAALTAAERRLEVVEHARAQDAFNRDALKAEHQRKLRELSAALDEARQRCEFIEQIQNQLQTLKSNATTWKAAIEERIAYFVQAEADRDRYKAFVELVANKTDNDKVRSEARALLAGHTETRP